ncbi:hypothetical protein F2Q70_00005237 [Brassica cretica]|uniref:Uncharacterized protein n=1 Tax=Brassica cretica TaxID=69181 RepID=A0A8S9IVG7_BRACR|nr:hypothetical protein F2Q70_00005237 [Brassica cretica]
MFQWTMLSTALASCVSNMEKEDETTGNFTWKVSKLFEASLNKDILIERVNIDFCLPASFTFWGHLNRSLNLEFNSVQVRKWTPEELLDQTAEAFGYTDGAVKLKKKWCDIVRFFEGYLFGQDTSRLLQCEATTKSYEEMIPPSRSHTPVYKL